MNEEYLKEIEKDVFTIDGKNYKVNLIGYKTGEVINIDTSEIIDRVNLECVYDKNDMMCFIAQVLWMDDRISCELYDLICSEYDEDYEDDEDDEDDGLLDYLYSYPADVVESLGGVDDFELCLYYL